MSYRLRIKRLTNIVRLFTTSQSVLEGLPELQELIMYGNKVAEIIIPTNPKVLSKLETLDLGYNDILWLPDELDQLKSLRVLKVMNNVLAKIPKRVCDMNLKVIDVCSNPLTEPPIEICERGIRSMRRYWRCIHMEEQSRKKTLVEIQTKQHQMTKICFGCFVIAVKKWASKAVTPRSAPAPLRTTNSARSTTEFSIASDLPNLSALSLRSSSFSQQKPAVGFVKLTWDESGAKSHRGSMESESAKLKRINVNVRLEQCEAVRFPFKKKLMLNNLNLTATDIPTQYLCGTALGDSLHKLSFAGNRLGSVPPLLVMSLPALKTLDLSQCELHQLPEQFNLPKLTRLNLSHNRFTDFPDEVRNFWCSIGCVY
jgi:Leucine-rich repeat (LRR) protein